MSELNKTTMTGGNTAPVSPTDVTSTAAPLPPPPSVAPTTEELLAQTLAELRQMREDQQKDREQIQMLTEVADKGRMEHIIGKRPKPVMSIVKVTYYDGKPVVAWRTVMDEVYKDSEGVWHEKQVVELTTEDGKPHKLDLVERFRNVTKVPATVISRRRTNDGLDGEAMHEVFSVKLEDGRELELDGAFIN